jgi:Spy/CpxP family protein refolding chaperone
MKKVTIVLAAFLFTATISFAQSSAPAAGNKRMAKFEQKKNEQYKNLNLTADQQTKLNAIEADAKTKAAAIKSNSSLTKEQKQQQMQALMQSTKQQSSAVLTADQQAQLKNDAKAARQHYKQGN